LRDHVKSGFISALISHPAGTKQFYRTGRTNELSGGGGTRLTDWGRAGGIGVSATSYCPRTRTTLNDPTNDLAGWTSQSVTIDASGTITIQKPLMSADERLAVCVPGGN